MNETEFNARTEAVLQAIEQALDACDADVDYERQGGGVLDIECADGGHIVINRHAAAGEIWVAARSGGFHFRLDDGRWVGTRDGVELGEALRRLIGAQCGAPVQIEFD